MACPKCKGQIFVSTDEPYRQVPCPDCGWSIKFAVPAAEELVIARCVAKRNQEKPLIHFPEHERN